MTPYAPYGYQLRFVVPLKTLVWDGRTHSALVCSLTLVIPPRSPLFDFVRQNSFDELYYYLFLLFALSLQTAEHTTQKVQCYRLQRAIHRDRFNQLPTSINT